MEKNRLSIHSFVAASRTGLRLSAQTVPRLFSALFFMAAALLLFSAVTPTEPERLRWVYKFIPLSVMEISHLISTISGIALMFLSLAIRQRVDSAYYLTIITLVTATLASLLKGWDVEEAALLLLLLLFFIPAKRYFYRRSRLLALDIPLKWAALALAIIGFTTWLGFYSYKHIAYSNELWLNFSLRDDPSRFLRSLGVITLIGSFFLLYRFLTRTYNGLCLPTAPELAEVSTLVHTLPESASFLALMGDKHIYWSPSRKSFIMFGITQQYWIAMGDPVGNPEEFPELLRAFRQEADRHSARIAFYQVGNRNVSLYLDEGMSLMKIGEQARVDLTTFTLTGNAASRLRQTKKRLDAEGLTFEVLTAEEGRAIFPSLRTISDAWLKQKNVREKCFSLGRFDEAYLCHCAIVVLKKEGQIIAFANLLLPDNPEEFSLDLMRYLPHAPTGVMEYLTILTILWGQAQGYRWFNLGMAPLAGLNPHHLATTWHRLGHLIFRFGGEFYNFKGLYAYKNKFRPEWKSRYLACAGNLQGTSVLFATSGLIAQGFKGIFRN